MTAFWTYDHLAQVTGGTWRVAPRDGGATLPAAQRDAGPVLWHDTRELQPGQCYLAIKGENFDGHDFIDDAFSKGAALAIINADAAPQAHGLAQPRRGIDPANTHPILEVQDTVKALQDLARAYRDELAGGGCKVIGVAGSNGKTTTRHLIHHVLTHAGKTGTQSPKSFNNHLGVPLTLLAARPGDDFVACEIGTNHPGEIDFLSAIARPDIAVITSIGEEHLEFFGDISGVLKEELSIIKHVVDGGDVVAGHLRNAIGLRDLRIRYTNDRVTLHHYADKENEPPHERILKGEHNRVNAAMAGAVARICSAPFPDWYDAIRSARPPSHRSEEIRMGAAVTVIDDCYNANPSSMLAAVSLLSDYYEYDPGRKRCVALLGDMLELGPATITAHRDVGEFIATCEIELTIVIGQFAQHILDILPGDQAVGFPVWSDDLPDKVAALLHPGDTVLLKASRGMRLERLIPAIEKRFGKADTDET